MPTNTLQSTTPCHASGTQQPKAPGVSVAGQSSSSSAARTPRVALPVAHVPRTTKMPDADRPRVRQLYCTTCPSECPLTIELTHGNAGALDVARISGNRCERGAAFAQQEITCPLRILATTVAVQGGDEALLPVRTAAPIPREQHLSAMELIRTVTVTAPIRMGDVIVPNLMDTGVNLVASLDVGIT